MDDSGSTRFTVNRSVGPLALNESQVSPAFVAVPRPNIHCYIINNKDEDPTQRILSSIAMLPTPVKTPQRKKSSDPPSSVSRVLFPHCDLGGADADMPPSKRRKGKKGRIGRLSLDSPDGPEPAITIFTDSRDRIPEVDRSRDNPFNVYHDDDDQDVETKATTGSKKSSAASTPSKKSGNKQSSERRAKPKKSHDATATASASRRKTTATGPRMTRSRSRSQTPIGFDESSHQDTVPEENVLGTPEATPIKKQKVNKVKDNKPQPILQTIQEEEEEGANKEKTEFKTPTPPAEEEDIKGPKTSGKELDEQSEDEPVHTTKQDDAGTSKGKVKVKTPTSSPSTDKEALSTPKRAPKTKTPNKSANKKRNSFRTPPSLSPLRSPPPVAPSKRKQKHGDTGNIEDYINRKDGILYTL